jgi:HEAT repeat protein
VKDFFISYNKADRQWAEWIAWQLEEAGFTTVIQAWDFRPGSNFVLEMHQAAITAERTIAVLSPDYLQSLYTQPEWAAAFAQDPTSAQKKLLPVRVRECKLEGLLAQIVYIDLTHADADSAKEALLAGIQRERLKPTTPPGFPGSAHHAAGPQPGFPGSISVPSRGVELCDEYLNLTGKQVGFVKLFGEEENRELKDVFVHLDISAEYQRPSVMAGAHEAYGLMDAELRRQRELSIESSDSIDRRSKLRADHLLEKYRHSVIVGAPGCGKTTLLKYLAWRTLKGRSGFPVFLELKTVRYGDAFAKEFEVLLFEHVVNEKLKLRSVQREEFEEHFFNLLRNGEVVIFLDGLDEIRGNQANNLFIAVNNFVGSVYGKNRIVISTRPYALSSHFDGFAEMEIAPLDSQQIVEFLTHYYGRVPQVKELVKHLRLRHEMRELARVPFLLSVIAFLYFKKGEIVGERLALYDMIVQELVDRLDQEKPVERFEVKDPGGSLKRGFLEQLAYKSLFTTGAEAEAQQLVFTSKHILAEAQSYTPPNERADLFVRDVIATPLLREIGVDLYAFAHLTIQEYLAATVLAREKECQRIFCRGYFNRRLVEMEVLPMTLGLVANPNDFYTELERLPESLTLRSLRLRARGLPYRTIVDESHLQKILDTALLYLREDQSQNNPWADIIFRSLSIANGPALDWIVRHLAAQLDYVMIGDYGISRRVAVGLGKIGSEAAVPALINALAGREKGVAKRAAEALGEIGSPLAIDALLQIARDRGRSREKPHRVSESAINALAKLGGEKAAVGLLDLLRSDDDSDIREKAATSLCLLGEPATVQELTECYRQEDCADVRVEIVIALGKLGGGQAVAGLALALNDPKNDVVNRTIEMLERVGGQEAIATLQAALQQTSMESQSYKYERLREALKRLGAEPDVDNSRATSGGLPQTDDTSPNKATESNMLLEERIAAVRDRRQASYTRADAVRELGYLADKRATEVLLTVAQDRNEHGSIRLESLMALGRISDPASTKALIRLLNDENEDQELRGKIISALGALGGQESVEMLADILRDGNNYLRLHVLRAFETMKEVAGNGKAIEAVLVALKQEDKKVRDWAIKLVPKLGQRMETMQLLKKVSVEEVNKVAQKPEKLAVALLHALCQMGEDEQRWFTCLSLEKLNKDDLVAGLLIALSDDDAVVRGKAAEIIGYYADGAVVHQQLRKLEKTEQERRVKHVAREAVRKFERKQRHFS